MNEQQKSKLIQWQSKQVYSMRDGGKSALDSIIKSARSKYTAPTLHTIPDLLNKSHPLLYFNFVIDWCKVPTSHIPVGFRDGRAFGKTVITEWQSMCARHKYFRDGLLENYQNIEQVKKNLGILLSDCTTFFHPDAVTRIEFMEEQLSLLREADEEREREAEKERIEQEESERNQREAEALRRENKEAEERRKQQSEHDQTAASNREFHDKDGSPWCAQTVVSSEGSNYYMLFEANMRTLQCEYSCHFGYPVSTSIGYKGNEYVLCVDARNDKKVLDAAEQLQYFSREHISECFAAAMKSLDDLRAAAKAEAEKKQRKADLQAQLDKLLADARKLQEQIDNE